MEDAEASPRGGLGAAEALAVGDALHVSLAPAQHGPPDADVTPPPILDTPRAASRRAHPPRDAPVARATRTRDAIGEMERALGPPVADGHLAAYAPPGDAASQRLDGLLDGAESPRHG